MGTWLGDCSLLGSVFHRATVSHLPYLANFPHYSTLLQSHILTMRAFIEKTKMANLKPNRLWLARKRLGYEQKQLARLLGYRTTQQISRLETGRRGASLKIALKLAIIYKLPVRVLFDKIYKDCQQELSDQAGRLGLRSVLKFDLTAPADFCSYAELMKTSFLTDIDKAKIRRHVVFLMRERTSLPSVSPSDM